MACYYINQSGQAEYTTETLEQCQGYYSLTAAELRNYMHSTELNAADATIAFVWGFSIVVFFAKLGYIVSVAKQTINKA